MRCKAALSLVFIWVLSGCSGGQIAMMPTPALYARDYMDPFPQVPHALQNNWADVLYLTDRVPLPDLPDGTKQFGTDRSRSVRFGVSRVEFGENLSWEELVRLSRSKVRDKNVEVKVAKTTELACFPPTPRSLLPRPTSRPFKPAYIGDEPPDSESTAADETFRKALVEKLSLTRQGEVYLFVHGYNNTFNDAVVTIAQLWHFFGREGVPVAYTWPAGASGFLRGYTRDSESSEFTVFHLKQCLRMIASIPEVERIHILAHSRGTAVANSALRELHLEIAGGGKSTREALKLGTLVLAAPDMDVDTVIQRMITVRLGQVPERTVLYVCSKDKALGISNWLVGGLSRLGSLQSTMFTPEELHELRGQSNVQVIDARVSDAGAFGHDYFHSNPAVSSDLILLMRYQLAPGAEHGRPLRVDEKGFWVIDDNYPGPPSSPATQPSTGS